MDTVKYLNFSFVILVCVGVTRVSTSCQNKYVINRGLTCDDKELIIELHNQLRQSVALGQVHGQPAASVMLSLSWDSEIAQKAQSLADTCYYRHDSNEARSVRRFWVGQNIATTWSTWEKSPEADFTSQIKAWFDEVGIYSMYNGWSHKTGHYSQMVWGETYLIGCGYNYFYDGYRYQKFYVCNYGPGGNVGNKLPYNPGQPSCDYYGMSPSYRYYGLCEPDQSSRNYYPDYSCMRYRRDAKNTTALVAVEVAKMLSKLERSKNATEVKEISMVGETKPLANAVNLTKTGEPKLKIKKNSKKAKKASIALKKLPSAHAGNSTKTSNSKSKIKKNSRGKQSTKFIKTTSKKH